MAALLFIALAAALWGYGSQIEARIRWSLLIFGSAIIAWTVLEADETPVALAAALALLATDATSAHGFYSALGHEVIWLMLGAFVMAAAWRHTGLLERWAARAAHQAGRVDTLMRTLTLCIAATAFLVPSTSGRAALLLPVFLALSQVLREPRLVRALALLFATVILLSAGMSMLGAGAHLVAIDAIRRLHGRAPDFLGWALLAGPFGLLCSLLACELILRLFLNAAERHQPVNVPLKTSPPLTACQRAMLAIQCLVIAAWCTQGWHGLDAALVAMAGALLMTLRPLTGLDLKQALEHVEWNLLLFMAATLVMAQALIDSGAAKTLGRALLERWDVGSLPPLALLAAISAVALLSHLLITSRTARTSVLIPVFALPLATDNVSATLLIFSMTLGSGFCQTLSASAKPVALFASQSATRPSDWLWLSLALLPGMWILLWVFSGWIWPL